MQRILTIIGTRPEVIKMAPLIRRLAAHPGCASFVCVSGQHRQMVDPLLQFFSIRVDFDLQAMSPGQTLNQLSGRIFQSIDAVLDAAQPDVVLVHGDTTTAMVAALAAFHRRIQVGHVEAGLRTGHLTQPWPEELNRRIIDLAATWLFAPTATARDNLLREHLPEKRIVVTGNTVIDALFDTIALLSQTEELRREAQSALPAIPPGKPLVLVTGHRRENFGDGMERICQAILQLVHVDPDLTVVYPVHLNPHVRKPVMALLSGHPRIHLIEPLDYPSFVLLMQQATLILTDSGGIQEEAPSIGKPVLVMREVTERPEAVQAGTVQLVGTDVERIVTAAQALLADPQARERYARQQNPYGDGRASERIISTLFGAPES